MPLHYNQTLCHFNAFICIFSSEVCLHHRQFSSDSRLPYTRLLQGLEGFPTDSALPGPGVRDSPTQQHICVTLSPPDGIQNESCSPSRARGLFGLFPRNNVPNLAAGFSPRPTVCAGSSCRQPAHLTSLSLFYLHRGT